MKPKLILLAALLLLVIVFAIQNVDVIDLKFLIFTITISRALLVLIIFGAGLLCGWLLTAFTRRRAKTAKT